MKKITYFLGFFIATSAWAQLQNSTYEPQHQELIEKTVMGQCSHAGTLFVVTESEKIISVDQGIQDKEFITELAFRSSSDQFSSDKSRVTVYSKYSDAYDHTHKIWGSYQISKVVCD